MVIDLKLLKDVIQREVVEPMDHRHLNHEVPPFDRVVPTAENLHERSGTGCSPPLSAKTLGCTRSGCTRPTICTWIMREIADATHAGTGFRLPTACTRTSCSAQANSELYGKCNNPYGHGHDYVLRSVGARAEWMKARAGWWIRGRSTGSCTGR